MINRFSSPNVKNWTLFFYNKTDPFSIGAVHPWPYHYDWMFLGGESLFFFWRVRGGESSTHSVLARHRSEAWLLKRSHWSVDNELARFESKQSKKLNIEEGSIFQVLALKSCWPTWYFSWNMWWLKDAWSPFNFHQSTVSCGLLNDRCRTLTSTLATATFLLMFSSNTSFL